MFIVYVDTAGLANAGIGGTGVIVIAVDRIRDAEPRRVADARRKRTRIVIGTGLSDYRIVGTGADIGLPGVDACVERTGVTIITGDGVR